MTLIPPRIGPHSPQITPLRKTPKPHKTRPGAPPSPPSFLPSFHHSCTSFDPPPGILLSRRFQDGALTQRGQCPYGRFRTRVTARLPRNRRFDAAIQQSGVGAVRSLTRRKCGRRCFDCAPADGAPSQSGRSTPLSLSPCRPYEHSQSGPEGPRPSHLNLTLPLLLRIGQPTRSRCLDSLEGQTELDCSAKFGYRRSVGIGSDQYSGLHHD